MEKEFPTKCPFVRSGVVESTNAEYLRDHVFINRTAPAPNMRRMTPVNERKVEGRRFLPWFWPDDELRPSVHIRRELFLRSSDVLQTSKIGEAATRAASQQLLELQADYLSDHFPALYSIENGRIRNKATDDTFDLRHGRGDLDPLAISGLLGQEDICIVEELEDGRHVMAAGFIASPTDWSLPDFIDLDMDRIHARVDRYHDRLKATIDRSMATLPEFPERQFARNNVFLEQNPSLAIFPADKPELEPAAIADPGREIFLRTERETLTRLPREHRRFIVFTIKPHVYPLSFVKDLRGKELAAAIESNDVLGRNVELARIALDYLAE